MVAQRSKWKQCCHWQKYLWQHHNTMLPLAERLTAMLFVTQMCCQCCFCYCLHTFRSSRWLTPVQRHTCASMFFCFDFLYELTTALPSFSLILILRFAFFLLMSACHQAVLILIAQGKQDFVCLKGGFQLSLYSCCHDISQIAITDFSNKVSLLTHCGLVTPYGDKDLGQHWLK